MQAKDLHSAYEKKMKLLREELEGRRKLEVRISVRASAPLRGSNRAAQVHEIEERKNQHIQELMKKCVRAPRRGASRRVAHAPITVRAGTRRRSPKSRITTTISHTTTST